MNLIIHDLEEKQFEALFPNIDENTKIIYDNGNIKSCVGCFGCWIKTPGKCVIKDGYENMGELFSKADSIIVISKCYYGCYSPFIKDVLDRSISYLLPSFEIIDNQTHHKQRYSNSFNLFVYFYGNDVTFEEKKTAQRLVAANAVGHHCNSFKVQFFNSVNELSKGVEIR
ncbi:MAG: flavodoxin family protein [Eubacterium sp.]|nr:flavodoxin family protein [Eubacterium sp.]